MAIDYEAAARYWQDKEADCVRMSEPDLCEEIEAFLGARKVGALATASADMVRSTPIEYFSIDDAIYMFSEGGLKFKALSERKDACLAIFDADPSFGSVCGLQVTGVITVVEPFSAEYLRACEVRGLDAERLRGLPFVMNLLRLDPTRFDLLESSLKNKGYSVRQWLEIARD